jgi:uncharacterized protein (DUF983 family)
VIASRRSPISQAVRRGLRCRCPRCGRGRLFKRPWRVAVRCCFCRLPFYRESGYFVGAMYLNFIISAVVATILFLLAGALRLWRGFPLRDQLAIWITLSVLWCLVLMRSSYGLWINLDFWISPWDEGASGDSEAVGLDQHPRGTTWAV